MATMTVAKALNAGLRRALEADPKVLLYGEDIGKLGGVFRITEHLQRDFGPERDIDSPLAESGIVGTAVGLALRGYRPVVEIQFDGFVYPAFDQIISQVSRFYFRSHGALKMPMVVRIPYGGGIGAIEHHSESPEAYFAHTPGLKVVTCSNPVDAYWMIQQSIASNNPIIFFEPTMSSRRWLSSSSIGWGVPRSGPSMASSAMPCTVDQARYSAPGRRAGGRAPAVTRSSSAALRCWKGLSPVAPPMAGSGVCCTVKRPPNAVRKSPVSACANRR